MTRGNFPHVTHAVARVLSGGLGMTLCSMQTLAAIPMDHFTLAQAGGNGSESVPLLWIIIAIVAHVVGLGVGFFVVSAVRGQTLKRAREEATELRSRAESDARGLMDKAKVDAERVAIERKAQVDTELDKSRGEMREAERRIAKREDLLDKKLETLTQKEEQVTRQSESLKSKEAALDKKDEELSRAIDQQREKLLAISQMSVEEAKREVLIRVEEDARHEMSKVVAKIVDEANAEAKTKAQEITLMAVQRYASEHTAESTVRAVPIPSDDMKGRIIGREGRNIRAIEKATGVDIIVDDTPGVIVVSCFDKIRQAVAVESLNRLIADGRMHPSRIEEVVEKVKGEMDERVQKSGKDAVLEVNLRGLHPKMVEAMGKLSFRTSYGQNVLRHSVEVAYLSQIIADQLGLDGTLARRCGFLHDIGKAMDHEMEGGHPKIGMDFAKQYGEKEAVLNAIGGHHADIPSTTFYTPIVMAADAVSSARPGARRESMEKYIQRLNELQDIALRQPGVTEAFAIQAGREVRVMVDAKRVNDDEAQRIAFDIAKKVSEEMTFPGEIRVTVLRETRAIEFAR
ncbi:MAG: ribonuclease Y [Phycisphaerales bacterium]|nr:ribonuclease Y [Phycisphaerales bacterium]